MKTNEKKPYGSKKFKGDEYAIPIYTPRSTYNSIRANDEMLLNDLTLNFDPFTISILKNEFRERDGEMLMNDFIMIIKDHLIHWQLDIPNRNRKLIRCLSLLFNDIDLNGNGNMEWDEFTNYIIEKAAVLNTMKNKNEEIKTYHPTNTRANIKLSKPIVKCIFIKMINRLAFFEEESDKIYFADPKTGQIDEPKELHVKIFDSSRKVADDINPPDHSAEKGMLLDIIFIDDPKYNLLLTSSNDGIIRMFKYANNKFKPADDSNQRDHEINHGGGAQMVIVWDTIDEILYSGQRDGIIRVWDQKSEPQYSQLGGKQKRQVNINRNDTSFTEDESFALDNLKNGIRSNNKIESFVSNSKFGTKKGIPGLRDGGTRKSKRPEGHTEVVTAILPLKKLQFLASASLDRRIILWDTIEKKKKREYSNYHKKGIMSLDFNENMILLISGGFDHDIYVWNPYIDSPVHQLSGHAAPIVSLKFVNNPLHVISLDTDFTLKVWDIKKFKCVDTLMMRENSEEKKTFAPQDICLLKNPLKLVISGKQLSFLEYDRNDSLTSADENVSICAKFIPSTLSLLTPVGNKIKLWNLLTGEVKKIFADITKNDISCVNLDQNSKRFMMGDTEGFVGVYNVTNGALIKTLSRHKYEIIGLIQSEIGGDQSERIGEKENPKFFVTASIDNVIKIHEDNELGESECLRSFSASHANITSMAFDKTNGRVILGSNVGALSLHEAATGKGNDEFSECEEEITSIVYLDMYSVVIYTNSSGQLKLIAVSPMVIKNTKIDTFENFDKETKKPVSIHKIVFCHEYKKLFLVDEHHQIICLDIKILIEELADKIEQSNEKKKVDMTMKRKWYREDWRIQAHDDMIKSIEYIPSENLLVTTCVDKSVRIFNSTNGQFVESLRQRKETERIKPIAYKKVESEEIYTPRMENRVDSKFKDQQRFKEKRMIEIQALQDQGITDFYDLDKEFKEYYGVQIDTMEAFKEYEAQEFDPYYYFKGKLDKHSIKNKNSNKWKLYLNFHNYYSKFEKDVDSICEQVEVLEKDLELKGRIGKLTKEEKEELKKNTKKLVKDSKDEKEPKKRAEKFVRYREKYQSEAAEEERKLRIKVRNERLKMKKKSESKHYKQLYKQGVKKDMIKKMNTENSKAKLSESEIEAARKFAVALAKYDEDDPRSLLFTGFETRGAPGKKRKLKNSDLL